MEISNCKQEIIYYILYDANDNGEYTYTSTAERTGIASGENQTFSSNYETKWRLLGVENTESGDYLILVPATPIKSTSQKGLMLKGSIGYQYGIDEIENISKIYGNGNGASHSRAIKIEDINKITGYNPLKTGDGKIFREGTANEYNNKLTVTRTGRASNELSYSNGLKTTYTYTAYKYFNEKREWTTLEIGETITITSTYYFYYPTTLTTSSNGEIKGITTDSREYGMLFSNNKSYWIASSYSLGGNNEEAISHTYGFFNVGQGYIRSCMDNYLIYVGGNTKQLEKNIIPIVCLDANIKLKATGNSINNKFTEWNIEK